MSVAAFDKTGRTDFVLERTDRGWAVRGPRDRCGGLFASREAALNFVRREGRAMNDPEPYRPPGAGEAA